MLALETDLKISLQGKDKLNQLLNNFPTLIRDKKKKLKD